MLSSQVLRRWLLLLAAFAPAACGDDDDNGGTPDARPTADASGGTADAATSPTFTLHYHRPLADYAGWTVEPTAGATAATPGTADGFGAVYTLPLTTGATSLTFSLKNGASTDPAGTLTVDVSGATREAWVISGWPDAIDRRLPALPGPNQVAVYYLRSDTSYAGWGLHTWGERVTETGWTTPVEPEGIDPEFGAGFLIDLTTGKPPGNCPTGRVCIIAHMGDLKDPGPDMNFDPAVLGNLVFLLTGSSDITATPRRVGDVGIAGVAAHLVSADTLAWCLKREGTGCVDDPMITQVELRHSATAEIAAEGTDITGGTVLTLTRRPGGLTPGQLQLAKYLTGAAVYEIAEGDRAALAEAVKGQLVAVARKAGGIAVKATQVNHALYLDEQFAYDGPLGVSFGQGNAPTLSL